MDLEIRAFFFYNFTIINPIQVLLCEHPFKSRANKLWVNAIQTCHWDWVWKKQHILQRKGKDWRE